MYLLVDNYDSFTWNVYHSITSLGAKVIVKRNNKINITKVSMDGFKVLFGLVTQDSILCLR